jgi:hypothetical protein
MVLCWLNAFDVRAVSAMQWQMIVAVALCTNSI